MASLEVGKISSISDILCLLYPPPPAQPYHLANSPPLPPGPSPHPFPLLRCFTRLHTNAFEKTFFFAY